MKTVQWIPPFSSQSSFSCVSVQLSSVAVFPNKCWALYPDFLRCIAAAVWDPGTLHTVRCGIQLQDDGILGLGVKFKFPWFFLSHIHLVFCNLASTSLKTLASTEMFMVMNINRLLQTHLKTCRVFRTRAIRAAKEESDTRRTERCPWLFGDGLARWSVVCLRQPGTAGSSLFFRSGITD